MLVDIFISSYSILLSLSRFLLFIYSYVH